MRPWTNGTNWLLGRIGLYAKRPLRSVSSDGTTRSITPEEARLLGVDLAARTLDSGGR